MLQSWLCCCCLHVTVGATCDLVSMLDYFLVEIFISCGCLHLFPFHGVYLLWWNMKTHFWVFILECMWYVSMLFAIFSFFIRINYIFFYRYVSINFVLQLFPELFDLITIFILHISPPPVRWALNISDWSLLVIFWVHVTLVLLFQLHAAVKISCFQSTIVLVICFLFIVTICCVAAVSSGCFSDPRVRWVSGSWCIVGPRVGRTDGRFTGNTAAGVGLRV